MSAALAITGLGATTAVGNDLNTLVAALEAGDACIRREPTHALTLLHTHPCAAVSSVTGTPLTRSAALAHSAVTSALAHAGIADGRGMGLALGTCTGGMPEAESAYLADQQACHPQFLHQEHHRISQALRTDFGFDGPQSTHSVACASAASAACEAIEWVRQGWCQAAIIVGADALCRVTVDGFHALRLLDPDGCRPLCDNRAGMSIGEAGAAIIIENVEHARQRGATIHASLLGWGLAADAHHATAPEPDGQWLEQAIRAALTNAKLTPEAVAYANTHGTGTPDNDVAECAALQRVFGPQLATASTKAITGHCMGAAAAVEAVIACLAIQHGRAWASAGSQGHPTLPMTDVIQSTRPLAGDVVLSTSLAFGGVDAALLFGGPERCA